MRIRPIYDERGQINPDIAVANKRSYTGYSNESLDEKTIVSERNTYLLITKLMLFFCLVVLTIFYGAETDVRQIQTLVFVFFIFSIITILPLRIIFHKFFINVYRIITTIIYLFMFVVFVLILYGHISMEMLIGNIMILMLMFWSYNLFYKHVIMKNFSPVTVYEDYFNCPGYMTGSDSSAGKKIYYRDINVVCFKPVQIHVMCKRKREVVIQTQDILDVEKFKCAIKGKLIISADGD